MVKNTFFTNGLTVNSNNVFVANAENNTIGIMTTNAAVTFDVNATDAIRVAVGNNAQRPVATDGLIRYNTEILAFESPVLGNWISFGGSSGDAGEVGAL